MEKFIPDDSTYKFVYKLPSNSILEFDFSFKKAENYETVLAENFEQEKIPKIILDDLNLIMEEFLYQEKRQKKTLSKVERENLDSKYFLQNLINHWLGLKLFKTHIECKY